MKHLTRSRNSSTSDIVHDCEIKENIGFKRGNSKEPEGLPWHLNYLELFSPAGSFDLFLVTERRLNACTIERNPRFQSCDQHKGNKIKLVNSKCQCCHHIKTDWLIFCANQLTGFYMMATLVITRLTAKTYWIKWNSKDMSLIYGFPRILYDKFRKNVLTIT